MPLCGRTQKEKKKYQRQHATKANQKKTYSKYLKFFVYWRRLAKCGYFVCDMLKSWFWIRFSCIFNEWMFRFIRIHRLCDFECTLAIARRWLGDSFFLCISLYLSLFSFIYHFPSFPSSFMASSVYMGAWPIHSGTLWSLWEWKDDNDMARQMTIWIFFRLHLSFTPISFFIAAVVLHFYCASQLNAILPWLCCFCYIICLFSLRLRHLIWIEIFLQWNQMKCTTLYPVFVWVRARSLKSSTSASAPLNSCAIDFEYINSFYFVCHFIEIVI